ncbi:hypothetical protein GQX74_006288 [Glossina fuscipes]|nr:hypothetical protein GQX74_006288 [Glossina fuscipes]
MEVLSKLNFKRENACRQCIYYKVCPWANPCFVDWGPKGSSFQSSLRRRKYPTSKRYGYINQEEADRICSVCEIHKISIHLGCVVYIMLRLYFYAYYYLKTYGIQN